MSKRRPMAGWYDPVLLAQTGLRVAISGVFGHFYDRREALAAANAITPQPLDADFDFSDHDALWLDFMADTGDGWNSTYAMFRLLAEDRLVLGGDTLPRARLLVLGGDEVYPTPSREEYENRLLGPMEAARQTASGQSRWGEGDRPALFAVPGNHDWYDGLNAFFGLFCRRRIAPPNGIGFDRPGRVIGGRTTHQTRSYFALQLPGGWWLWVSDSQLEGYIDQPQIEYFEHAARFWMAKGSKLILCAAVPSWEYVDEQDPRPAFSSFSYLERLAGVATDEDGATMGHVLKLVLTGDSHHYTRMTEGDRHYITCGGGGAFLHPTHHIRNKDFLWDYPPPGEAYRPDDKGRYRRSFTVATRQGAEGEEALFPSRTASRALTFWNLLFAFKNYKFTAVLAIACLLFAWLLDANARRFAQLPLTELLGRGDFLEAWARYASLVLGSPGSIALLALMLGGFTAFAKAQKAFKWVQGGLHAAAQAAAISAASVWGIRAALQIGPDMGHAWPLLAGSVAAGFAAATTFGLYLLISLNLFGLHWNEAFSAFAHRGYKGFLRMRIGRDGSLDLYPVGLKNVPWDRGRTLRNPELSPELIEAPLRWPADRPMR